MNNLSKKIRNMNRNKKTVRLTESELRNFIKEAVATVLRENEVMSNITEGEVLNIINYDSLEDK